MSAANAEIAWLFCPADRPERYSKAAATADVVILDLEDGVAPSDRPAARAALVETLLDPAHTVVRISPFGTADHALDLEALAGTPYSRVMLAKTESGEQAASLAPRDVVALCETPRGIINAPAIALEPAVRALFWGAEDLLAALGGQSSRDDGGRYRDVARHARASVLLAAGAEQKVALDSVYLNIKDVDGLRAEALDAAESGFGAKACIHPSQVEVVRAAYRPAEDLIERSRRVLAAAAAADRGVFSFEGRMVDEPVLRHARAVLARAGVAD